jgi:lysine-N-methylase
MNEILVPDYYEKFHCIAADCEDSCCSGWWKVSVDEVTYQGYEQCQQPELAPLFKVAISRNAAPADENDYGLMQMKLDGSCHFLQADKQCAIHQQMGAKALSDTCRLYPRYLNRFGAQRENSLGISCPEAARLVLLNDQPMSFKLIEADSDIDGKAFTSYQFPRTSNGDDAQIGVLNDFRAVIIAILQCRSLSIGARMMLLGFMLEDADKIISSASFSNADELLPTLQGYVGMLDNPARIEAQFEQVEPRLACKLVLVDSLIQQSLAGIASTRFRECLNAAAEGLSATDLTSEARQANYAKSHADYFQPFFKEKAYIFENYLVNQVFTRLFPFTRDQYLNLYRELVGNLALIEVLLVGIAAKNRGLSDAQVVQLFQTFARHSNHNRGYLEQMIEVLQVDSQDSFVTVMWLLRA